MKRKIATHTPGPWAIKQGNQIVAGEICVAYSHGPAGPFIEVDKEHSANAHLIAAAPDMKESLQVIDDLGNVDGNFTNDELLALIEQMREEAKSAIAKAETKS